VELITWRNFHVMLNWEKRHVMLYFVESCGLEFFRLESKMRPIRSPFACLGLALPIRMHRLKTINYNVPNEI
jgi:hypothetical protein